MTEGRILIADDESGVRMVLSRLLACHGYSTQAVQDGRQCLSAAEGFAPDLVLLDLKMPGLDGLATLQALQEKGIEAKVIIMTAFGTIPGAVEAMRIGAYDYITKPFDNNELLIVIERALRQSGIESELREARSRLEERYSVSGIITNNPRMLKLLDVVVKIAPSDAPVLITGGSGTGKELFAKAVHQHSGRKNRPFVALNCGALPESLIESELFGYRSGAFTGAKSSKQGLVERADGGSLFLDEISEMGPESQVKLLRFVQSGEFFPLGSTEPRTVDVRFLAASNRDVKLAVSAGRLREDLLYRLNVVSIDIPPLRERPEDIVPLADHFIKKHGEGLGKAGFRFSPEAVDALQLHDWPGNVRELENVVHSALLMAAGSPIGPDALPVSLKYPLGLALKGRQGTSLPRLASSAYDLVERQAIIEALERCAGNRSRAAGRLGISRRTLLRKIKKYQIT